MLVILMFLHIKMPLKLKNVLHVPHIQRNLLSVAKLTTNNDVFVKFF